MGDSLYLCLFACSSCLSFVLAPTRDPLHSLHHSFRSSRRLVFSFITSGMLTEVRLLFHFQDYTCDSSPSSPLPFLLSFLVFYCHSFIIYFFFRIASRIPPFPFPSLYSSTDIILFFFLHPFLLSFLMFYCFFFLPRLSNNFLSLLFLIFFY